MKVFFVASLLLVFAGVVQAVSEGLPYLQADISFSPTFDTYTIQSEIVAWLIDQSILPSGTGYSVVVFQDSAETSTGIQSVNISLDSSYDNVKGWDAWSSIASPMQSGAVFDPDVNTANATAVENPVSNVVVGIEAIADGYNDSFIYDANIELSATPTVGNSVEITLSSASATFAQSTYTVTYPAKKQSFSIKGEIGTHTISVTVTGGTDSLGRYSVNATIPTYTVGYRENFTVTEPTTETYAGAASDLYTLKATQYRSSTMDLVVQVVPSSSSVIVFPSNITVGGPDITKTFVIRGPVGVYTLSYVLADPWMTDSGMKATSNTDFYTPEENSTLVIHEPLNISMASIPRGYLVNEPVGTWGGAFSTFTVHIERDPRAFLELTPSDADGSTDVEFSPTSLVFQAGGAAFQRITARAKTTGYKTIKLTRSGSSSDHYSDATSKIWIVTGKNLLCHTASSQSTCRDLPACFWDARTTSCGNKTLTPVLSPIPELFDQEETQNITITLPTAPLQSFTMTFIATARLTFKPASITFDAGETTKNFTILASLDVSDGAVQQFFRLALSGRAAQEYTQLDIWANIRPRVVCVVNAPTRFFVGTTSEPFALTCDTSPEVEVIFTPKKLTGIEWIPIGGSAGDSATMTTGVRTVYFVASSVTAATGAFYFEVTVSGANAVRYQSVSPEAIVVLPSGEVLTPPTFYLTAFDTSPFFHIDVTVLAPTILEVVVEVQTSTGLATTDVTVYPAVLKYNNTKRNLIKAVGYVPGWYKLVFTIAGEHKANYIAPPDLPFQVRQRLDGKAFEARTQVGFVPQLRCRVRVGRQSLAFKGQAPIDNEEDFCDVYPSPAQGTSFNCSIHATEERCRNELSSNGNVCVWHESSCQFLSSLQGKLKMAAYGSGFTVLLTTSGRVYSIGSTRYGQLGHYNSYLTEVPMPGNISAISAGTSHSIALTQDGFLYSWGANHKGQLGQNTRVKQTEILGKVDIPKGENVSCISSGTLHVGALTLSGKVFMWGSNEYGQLGSQQGYRTHTLGPHDINREYFNGEPAVSLQCGEYHTMVATSIEAFTFGSNIMGQLGRDGFDEWKPAVPELWTPNKYNTKPNHRSYVTGRDNC